MDTSMFQDFVVPIAVAAAFVVGYVVKNIISSDAANRFIPLICAIVGVAISCWADMAFTATTVVTGLVSGLAATGLYEGYKGLISKVTSTE